MPEQGRRTIYAFLDESGDLTFSRKGSKHFVITCVTMTRPFPLYAELEGLKYDLIERGEYSDSFHCSHDKRFIRHEVFNLIASRLEDFRIDALVVDKPKAAPALTTPRRFYPRMLGLLLRHVVRREATDTTEGAVVITDTIPIREKRASVEKAVKSTLAGMLPATHKYQLRHHSSRSHVGLQVADYCSWAIFKKYEAAETTYYDRIRASIMSEFPVFARGRTEYY